MPSFKLSQSWITLIGAAIVALSSGTNYCVSAYLPQLADRLELTATESNLIAAAGNAGMYFSLVGIGPLIDRFGATPCLYAAAACLFSGWIGIRTIDVAGGLPGGDTVGLALLCGAQLVTGLGSTFGTNAAINGVARSFPSETRGTAISATLCCVGLSAFLYSTIYRVVILPSTPSSDEPFPTPAENDGVASFLLLLATGCGISMLIGAWLVKPALYDRDHPGPSQSSFASVPGVPATEITPLLAAEACDVEAGIDGKSTLDKDAPVVNLHGREMLSTADFWILFGVQGLLGGIGLLYINNLGAIIKALDYANPTFPSSSSSQQTYLVALLSLSNASGRIYMGSISDFFIARGVNRIWWATPVSALFVGSILLAIRTEVVGGWAGLAVPTVLLGFAYGNLFGLLPVLCLETFGLKSFASNNGLLVLSIATAGQITNYVFGHIYDSHSIVLPDLSSFTSGVGGLSVCEEGRSCYTSALWVAVGMGLSSLALSVYGGWRRGKVA